MYIPLQTPVILYNGCVQGGYTFHGHLFLIQTSWVYLTIIDNREAVGGRLI